MGQRLFRAGTIKKSDARGQSKKSVTPILITSEQLQLHEGTSPSEMRTR